jgi:hypothetical protein
MKRFARWLRLVVTCLAFVIGSPSPAIAADAFDTIVMVASDDRGEEVAADEHPLESGTSVEAKPDVTTTVERPRLVSRLYLANCALLL